MIKYRKQKKIPDATIAVTISKSPFIRQSGFFVIPLIWDIPNK